MDAKVKAYIDFGNFSEKNIERSSDKITAIRNFSYFVQLRIAHPGLPMTAE